MGAFPSTFDAFAQHPSLGESEAAGKLSLRNSRLLFQAPGIALEIPLVRLQLSPGPDSAGQRIDLSDPQQPDWTLYTFDADFLSAPELRQQPNTRRQIQQLQSPHELRRRLKLTLYFFCAFVALLLLGSLATGLMVRSLVNRIPPAWERQFGDAVWEKVQPMERFSTSLKLKAKLDQAVAPLLKQLPMETATLQFHISDSSIPNAMAFPGGHVIVNAGLIELADRPEELAGVIAHELAHVARKHAFRKILSDAGPYLVLRIFFNDRSGLLGLLGSSSERLIQQSFSQDFEREADATGWDYLVAARIDPRGMIDMLKKLKLTEDQLGIRSQPAPVFRSHPPTLQRIEKLEAKWRKLKNKSGFLDLSLAPASN